jgi:CxxC-x17-CxxC domain-containing protein
MPYVDKQLSCVDCGTEFAFTAGEQERFAQLGFTNEPKRCAPCRAAKKAAGGGGGAGRGPRGGGGGGGGAGAAREFHTAKCAGCGGEARVPFKPRGDRPVYCSSCFDQEKKATGTR